MERLRSAVKLMRCREKIKTVNGHEVHPGWIAATKLLLKGLERLKKIEDSRRQ